MLQNAPHIARAIPKARYHYGEFIISILGEVESNDPMPYKFIAAFVKEGGSDPELYICSQKARRAQAAEGSHSMRVINEALSEIVSTSNDWADLNAFADEVLDVGAKLLQLTDVQPYKLI